MSTPLYLRGGGRGRGSQQRQNSQPKKPVPSLGSASESPTSAGDEKRNLREKSSPSEKKDSSDMLLSKIIQKYEADTSSSDLGSTSNFLSRTMTDHASSCPICLEDIKKTDPIWFCGSCFTEYHLQCIQKWVKEMLALKFYHRHEDSGDTAAPELDEWSCPSCRHPYHRSRDWPDRYRCYCGKLEDPPFDPWLLPHSCGEVCRRSLAASKEGAESEGPAGCTHMCLLLCHPGPCPPCPQMVQVSCHCGRSPATSRRCSQRAWACAATCNRLLQCLAHRCAAACHPGPCPPCRRTSLQPCVCGAGRQLRSCQQLEWQCDKECGRPLACGQHRCQRVCHIGDCGLCPNFAEGGVRLCPCGKTRYSDLACTEEAPPCGDTCGRALACARHTCDRPCHSGACGPCREQVDKPCRCGAGVTRVDCAQELVLCNARCQRRRPCGRHPCKRRCCDGHCPACEHPCGRSLNCRNHKCPSRCHAGPCYLCGLTIKASCACGGTELTLPCGALRNKKEVTVRCELPCKRLPPVRDCGHKTPRHTCHPGPCPPCRDTCARALQPCGHACPSSCHQEVLVQPEPDPQRAQASGPWEARAPSAPVLRALPCPPCEQLVQVQCRGEHEALSLRCHNWTRHPVARSCGNPCGRLLACSNHACDRECHFVSGSESVPCDTCTRECEQPRPEKCSHQCALGACHPGDCPPCAILLRHRCHCSSMAIYVACAEWLGMAGPERRARLTCPGRCPRELACGHQCPAGCHAGPCRDTGQRCTAKVNQACACGGVKRRVPCVERDQAVVPCGEKCRRTVAKANGEERDAGAGVLGSTSSDDGTTRELRQRKREKRNASSGSENTNSWLRRRRRFLATVRRFAPVALGVVLLGLLAWAVIESTQM